jgi:AcrR family transcriptional regulator
MSVWYAAGVRPTDAAQRPRADRRAQIVQVAFRLIAERGLEGLRFSDVAREAGINNGTLLYYFASKEALIQAVGAYLVEQFMQVSQASLPPHTDAPLDALGELRLEFADARERLHDQVSVVYTELLARAQRDATVATLLRDIDAGWRGWLTGILERGRTQGRFAADLDVDLVVTTIMASIRGVGMQALVMQDAEKAGSVMDAVAALIERWVVTS